MKSQRTRGEHMSVAAAFNQKQVFNRNDVMFLVMERPAVGWCVLRVDGRSSPKATMVAERVDDEAGAVAIAERARLGLAPAQEKGAKKG